MLTRLRRFANQAIDRQAGWVANWLYSRSAFIGLVYGTIGWVPLVILGVDHGGFLYLYIATSLSLITQNPLAMLARWASQEARKNDALMQQMLTNQADMIRLLLKQMAETDADVERIIELGRRSLDIRLLRDEMLAREEHVLAVRSLVEALEAGLLAGGLPLEAHKEVYRRIDREFEKWERKRSETEQILDGMSKQIQDESGPPSDPLVSV